MTAAFVPRGVYVPLVTPFKPDGAVDHEALKQLADAALSAGAAGIVTLATTAEPSALTRAEADAVVATLSKVCLEHERDLIVGAGTNDTRTTVERHQALEDVPGCSASLAVVPYYVRPTEAAIVKHFQFVAERSPVPVVLYNVPYRTGRGLGSRALLELAHTPNIAGLKQAVGAVDLDTLELLADRPDGFSVLGGDDPYLLPLTLMGAQGAIAASANLHPARFVRMIELGLAGDVVSARREAEALLPLTRDLFAEPSPAVLKAVLYRAGLIATPDVRMPLENASSEAAEQGWASYAHLS